MNVVTLTDDNFETEVNSSEKPVLVDYWATWCGPCKMVGPIVEEIAIERRDDNPDKFPNDSLDLQFRIPFQLRYRGVQLRFESLDMGDVELLGFAIELKKA